VSPSRPADSANFAKLGSCKSVPKFTKPDAFISATSGATAAGPEPLPGWGAADAYLYLARDLLDHGDAVGARDALEHALLLAPDYAQARRLMAKIASG